MDHITCLGTHSYVHLVSAISQPDCSHSHRDSNSSAPRLASSSKDGTVRVWSPATRRVEYTLGGHAASVNVVKWGGTGGVCGVLYTASSDRTVRIWDAEKVCINCAVKPSNSQDMHVGSTTTHPQRPRTLGHHSRPQHGFCPPDGSFRSHQQKTFIR